MDAVSNCWGVLTKIFSGSKAMVPCQLLHSDVVKFMHETMKEGSSAFGRFHLVMKSSLLPVFFGDRMIDVIASSWSS